MTTTTVPTPSVPAFTIADLDALIVASDALDGQWTALIGKLDGQLDHLAELEREIARLERMNPVQVAGLAAFADVAYVAAELNDEEDAAF